MRGSRPALLLAAAAVLLLVVVAARGQSAVPSHLNDVQIDYGLPPAKASDPGNPNNGLQYVVDDPVTFGAIVAWVAGGLFVLALVLSVLAALRARKRNRVGVGDVIDPVEGTIDTVLRLRLKEAAEQARETLARPEGEPGDAVIRAWVTLEHAGEHTRAPHQTATEFTISLLAKETADEEAVRQLRTLYHRARFGHRSDERDAAAARDALDRILATIR
ncbi:DUF4129 domain-containing protein [Actinophytocola sp.]|uniref:DUF4129 domain-containing protein n=1 Tax=Actinophytocola sp. TaxID=1872138 RepID=UPI002ED63D14